MVYGMGVHSLPAIKGVDLSQSVKRPQVSYNGRPVLWPFGFIGKHHNVTGPCT